MEIFNEYINRIKGAIDFLGRYEWEIILNCDVTSFIKGGYEKPLSPNDNRMYIGNYRKLFESKDSTKTQRMPGGKRRKTKVKKNYKKNKNKTKKNTQKNRKKNLI